MRLIDADKLMLSLNDNFLANSPTGNETLAIRDYRESICEGLEIAMATVEGALTIDAVPVTRCGDCKYYDTEYHCKLNGYSCGRSPDWFCADGKKEEEECTSTDTAL